MLANDLNHGKLVVITGMPASGKDTIIELILNRLHQFERIVTYTNRPIRQNEIPGKELNFVSTQTFERMIAQNEFFEYVKHGPFYKGTTHSSIKKVLAGYHLTWNIEVTRAGTLKETFEEKFDVQTAESVHGRTKVVLLQAESMQTAYSWFKNRNPKSERKEFEMRWNQIQKFVSSNRNRFPHVVTNVEGKPEIALEQIIKLISS